MLDKTAEKYTQTTKINLPHILISLCTSGRERSLTSKVIFDFQIEWAKKEKKKKKKIEME